LLLFASSWEIMYWYMSIDNFSGIELNKFNKLGYAQYFGSAEGVRSVMRKNSGIIAQKFTAVQNILQERLGEYEVARWTKPEGGYFISVDVIDGTASPVWELAKEAGIVVTKAGAASPGNADPNNRNSLLPP